MALGRECQLQRGAVTLPGSAVSLRSRPGGSKGSVLTHMALSSSKRHLPEALSCLNTQSPGSSLPELNDHDPVSNTSPARFVHGWVVRTPVLLPPAPILSDSLVSSPTPTLSTLWPLLPGLPGIPLIWNCQLGSPPSPSAWDCAWVPGACLMTMGANVGLWPPWRLPKGFRINSTV